MDDESEKTEGKKVLITGLPEGVAREIKKSADELTVPFGTRCRQILINWAAEKVAAETLAERTHEAWMDS